MWCEGDNHDYANMCHVSVVPKRIFKFDFNYVVNDKVSIFIGNFHIIHIVKKS